MFIKRRLLLPICLVLLINTYILSQTQQLSTTEVLQSYRESLSYLMSVSMNMSVNVDVNNSEHESYQSELFPQRLHYVFRRDEANNRAEWVGGQLIHNDLHNVNSEAIKEIADGKMHVSLAGDRFVDEPVSSRRVILRHNYTESLKALFENPNWGAPLFGNMYGSNHRSVTDLLGESPDIHLRGEAEDIEGVSCLVLEGTSKYGKVTAWISPEKGHNAVKWIIEKDSHHFFDESPVSEKWPKVTNWQVIYNVEEFNEVRNEGDVVFVPKLANFTFDISFINGTKNTDHFEYKISDVQLKPDFDALGAFKIDLPDGIRVFIRDFPSAKFIWDKGKPVTYVDQKFLEDLDAEIVTLQNETKTDSVKNMCKDVNVLCKKQPAVTRLKTDMPRADTINTPKKAIHPVMIGILVILATFVTVAFYRYRRNPQAKKRFP